MDTDIKANNLYCGDSYELIKNIPDKSIDLVIIDPPYEFCQGGKGSSEMVDRKDRNKQETYSLDTDLTKRKVGTGYSCGGGCFGTKNRNYYSQINETDITPSRQKYLDYVKEHGKDKESARLKLDADKVDSRNSVKFISKGITNEILTQLVRVMKKINIYIWCSKAQLRQLLNFFGDLGCNLDLLTWHKTNPIPTCNNTYLSDTEYCVFAREGGVKLYGSVETKKKYYVTGINTADKELYKHPTIKPLNIIKNLIINSSKENDIVLDCFMGSGTTCVAAKELNRQYIGIELDPTFYKIAKDRLNGIDANGQTSIFTDFENL